MDTLIWAQECQPQPIGDHPPASPIAISDCSPWMALLARVSQWTLWLSLVVCLASVIIMIGMITADRNKGEAGIASSIQVTVMKWVIGTAIVSSATTIAAALFMSTY
ncbi:hypothetical protein [Corynebacterium auriscanis]|uniref:hypothetical protein n=1 Tax=Corynebacterium auriscanis TaxID=99807 RepID=UPI003CF3FA91